MPDKHADYCRADDIISIGNLDGLWRRLPDHVRYEYVAGKRTTCPVCKDDAAGIPWGGWFSCDFKGCCVALVNTGEVFVRADPIKKIT